MLSAGLLLNDELWTGRIVVIRPVCVLGDARLAADDIAVHAAIFSEVDDTMRALIQLSRSATR